MRNGGLFRNSPSTCSPSPRSILPSEVIPVTTSVCPLIRLKTRTCAASSTLFSDTPICRAHPLSASDVSASIGAIKVLFSTFGFRCFSHGTVAISIPRNCSAQNPRASSDFTTSISASMNSRKRLLSFFFFSHPPFSSPK